MYAALDNSARPTQTLAALLRPPLQDAKKKRLWVSPEQLSKTAALQNFLDKQHASHQREMKKYVLKRWDYCKYKKTREEQSTCVRDTVETRYRNFVAKEHIPYGAEYVEDRIKELQSYHAPPQVPRWTQLAAGGG